MTGPLHSLFPPDITGTAQRYGSDAKSKSIITPKSWTNDLEVLSQRVHAFGAARPR
jgi:hypothetical protein